MFYKFSYNLLRYCDDKTFFTQQVDNETSRVTTSCNAPMFFRLCVLTHPKFSRLKKENIGLLKESTMKIKLKIIIILMSWRMYMRYQYYSQCFLISQILYRKYIVTTVYLLSTSIRAILPSVTRHAK